MLLMQSLLGSVSFTLKYHRISFRAPLLAAFQGKFPHFFPNTDASLKKEGAVFPSSPQNRESPCENTRQSRS